MATPLINAPKTISRFQNGKPVSQRDLVATMYQALKLTQIGNVAAKHRLNALKVALEHPTTMATIHSAPETFEQLADILDWVGAEQTNGNPDSPWVHLARTIRDKLPNHGYGITPEMLKQLDRKGIAYGIAFSLVDNNTVAASGTGGQISAAIEKTPFKETLVLLETTPTEARKLINDPAGLRTAYRQQMARKTLPPMAELAAFYPQLSFGLNKNKQLTAKVKTDPTAVAEELTWLSGNQKSQNSTFMAIERLNLSARRHSPSVHRYMENANTQARHIETELFKLDQNRIDKLKSTYGPAAVELNPGRPTVRPVFPTTNQAWAQLVEEIEQNKTGAPQYQVYEIRYPQRGPVSINWNTQATPDQLEMALQQINMPNRMLEEKVGRNFGDLPVQEVRHRLDPHKEPETKEAVKPPPPPVQERNHYKELVKEHEREQLPSYDYPLSR